jgi:hypothetical protein
MDFLKEIAMLTRHAVLPFLFLAACGGEDAIPAIEKIAQSIPTGDSCLCAALGVDYTNHVGIVSAVGLPSMSVAENLFPGAVSGDPVIRDFGARLVIVNRYGADNVTVIDKATWTVEHQFSTGAGSNPQDAALLGDKLYVVTLGAGAVQVWDLSGATPAAAADTVDLASYDTDGNPDAASVYVRDGRAYVTLSRLDGDFLPQGNGKVVVIDTTTDEVDTDFDLSSPNPFGFIALAGSDLLVETVDDFSGATGCLQRISASGAGECVVDNSELGGTVSGVAHTGGDHYLAVTAYDAEFNPLGELVKVDGSGAVSAPLSGEGQVVVDVASCAASGEMLYADRHAGGLRVLNVSSGQETTTTPIDLGLQPALVSGIVCFAR